MRRSMLIFAMTLPLLAQSPAPAVAKAAQTGPFDPTRDVQKDLVTAKGEAKKTGRRILLDVGGNWCSWCRLMHVFFETEKDLREQRDKGFVTLLVNYSPENKNEAFLKPFPKVKGYPHFYVLDADGKLLHSQDTGELEEGKGYSREKMATFFTTWSAKK